MENQDKINVFISDFFRINPIRINELGVYTWADAVSESWCTGLGTKSDPYIIKNLVIDGDNQDSCISIMNSNVFFRIENCTLFNSAKGVNAGIFLTNVNNGELKNNNCSFNNGEGIILLTSNKISVSRNIINSNKGHGMSLTMSHSNTIFRNNVSNNYFGIWIELSNNNSVFDDNFNGNSKSGIILTDCINNNISGNGVHNNIQQGLYIINSNKNLIIGNNIANNLNDGIYLEKSNNQSIFKNTLDNCTYGISLMNSYNNSLGENFIYRCGLRISESSIEKMSSNNIGITNLVNEKKIYFYKNENNLRTKNFSNAGQILLVNCNNTLISNTNTSQVSIGISLYYCNNNTILDSVVSNNIEFGIYLFHSNQIAILANNLSSNKIGICLLKCKNISLYSNSMRYCGIKLLESSIEEMTSHNIDNTNLINQKPVYYFSSISNLQPNNFLNAGQIILINCSNSWVSNVNISFSSIGISLFYCTNGLISNCIATYNNDNGIYVSICQNITISRNEIIHNGKLGIGLINSSDNIVVDNLITNNTLYGLFLTNSESTNNLIYKNKFIGNHMNARDDGIGNRWDNDIIGNYWDDYQGMDANDNGIGDIPYFIEGTAESQDNFPIWNDGPDPNIFFFIIVGMIISVVSLSTISVGFVIRKRILKARQKGTRICIVCRGLISGNIYLCPKCQAFYCERCASVLKENDDKCWSCDSEINF
ncbi:MAG: nitrous oxide reductase family maturation protein NosD [Promethearchaeota archaeon]